MVSKLGYDSHRANRDPDMDVPPGMNRAVSRKGGNCRDAAGS